MKRNILVLSALALTLLLSLTPRARAQALYASVKGQVFDMQGNPFPGVTVLFRNTSNGQKYETKTGKDGRYLIIGLTSGDYDVHFIQADIKLDWVQPTKLQTGREDILDFNLKEEMAKKGPSPEEIKKKEEAEKKFQGMRGHFDAGRSAMDQANAVRTQMYGTPSDQRGPLRDKMNGLYQTAVGEFEQAQQAANPNDPDLAIVVSNLGAAYESVGQFDKAVESFQKAVNMRPMEPNFHIGLATNLENAGKSVEANAACDRAAAINSAAAGICWRNLGIVLRNAEKRKEAVAVLQKATEADPNNAEGWYLMATSLLSSIETKQEGDKLSYIIPPGTAEAYQKCIDLAPDGPHAGECKDGLASLAALGQGVETRVSVRKKKK
jgi:tetratricopeptide (TPR) repeat protein